MLCYVAISTTSLHESMIGLQKRIIMMLMITILYWVLFFKKLLFGMRKFKEPIHMMVTA